MSGLGGRVMHLGVAGVAGVAVEVDDFESVVGVRVGGVGALC